MTATETEILEHVSVADALAELQRRSKPRSERDAASNRWAQRLMADQLREIAAIEPSEVPEPEPVTESEPEVVTPEVMVVTAAKPKSRPRAVTTPASTTPVAFDVRPLTPIDTSRDCVGFVLPLADLAEAVKAIEAPAKTRSSLPILGCVVVQAKDGAVTLTTTDLDTTMQVQVPATVSVEGAAAIPFKAFKDAIPTAKKNQTGDADISVEGSEAKIATERGTTIVSRCDLADWPTLPEVAFSTEAGNDKQAIDLDLDAIASVVPSAAKEETRPILTGVLFVGNHVVTTDSYRLAECSSPTMHFGNTMLVPAAFLAGLVKRGKRAKAIVGKFQMLVTDETGLISVTRLIDGEFPNYSALFPTETPERITFDNAEMTDALSGLIARKPLNTTPVRFSRSAKGGLQLHMIEADNFDVTVNVAGQMPEIEVGFNVRYLRDLISGGFDHLNLIDALKPIVTERTDEAGRNHRRLLMPVRIS